MAKQPDRDLIKRILESSADSDSYLQLLAGQKNEGSPTNIKVEYKTLEAELRLTNKLLLALVLNQEAQNKMLESLVQEQKLLRTQLLKLFNQK